ncbi:MAG: murein biosynthesis integral membrane protein MurJ [Chloroflexi bacterium]|nr:murein biosynthesis integral membrane protein MurJ [Chloroflexota bacterium]
MSQAVEQSEEPGASVARNAAVLSAASIVSRVLGMVREIIIPHYFGATGMVSAFRLSEFVVRTLYDLLVGGMLSAALVPVLSDYWRPERRAEFAHVASIILTAVALIAAAAVLGIEIFAEQIIFLIGGNLEAEYQSVAVDLMRLTAPAVWVFTSSGVLAGILFARERFTLVALGDALYNLGVILIVPLFHDQWGVASLAVGILVGSLIQIGFRLPELRGLGIRPNFDFRHPILRKVWHLYLPILVSVLVGMVQGGIDRRLASGTGAASLAYMGTATTLYQFPHGLVAVAISMAALPSLSRFAARQNWSGYRHTLGAALRVVMVLVVPATIGLWVLAEPAVRLLAEHGKFTAVDTLWTYQVLRYYLVGLIFASVDWPLNFSFYARGDSKTPAIVGIISVFVYLAVALSLLDTLSLLGLALANGVMHAAHATMMAFLLYRWGGRLHQGVLRTSLLTLMAGLIMGVFVYVSAEVLLQVLGTAGLVPRVLVLLIPGMLGAIVYYLILRVLRVPEIGMFEGRFRRMIKR